MSLFVRVRDVLYHIPSISSITLVRSKIIKRPTIHISYHRGKPDRIYYSKSTGNLQNDFLLLINSFNSYNEHIRNIPLFITVIEDVKDINL